MAELRDALIGQGGGDITVDMAAGLAARMAGACTMSRRCGRIGDTKAVIRQPIDWMIRRLLIAAHIARCRCAGIGDLRRGRSGDRCRGADVSPTSIWSIVAGHVLRISDITKSCAASVAETVPPLFTISWSACRAVAVSVLRVPPSNSLSNRAPKMPPWAPSNEAPSCP